MWKQYRRKGLSEMREYIPGEDLTDISVSKEDDPPNDLGMIARNPDNHDDQWYVAREWFLKNFEPIEEQGKVVFGGSVKGSVVITGNNNIAG